MACPLLGGLSSFAWSVLYRRFHCIIGQGPGVIYSQIFQLALLG